MNIDRENQETFISLFDIYDLILRNISKIIIFTILSLAISVFLIISEKKTFEFYLELDPPNELLLEELDVLKNFDSNYDLDVKKIYDIYIYNIANKETLIRNLKKNISPDHKYISNRLSSNYENEIDKLAYDIKILKPVLDKDIARIRNTSLLENYALKFIGSQDIQNEIFKSINLSLFEIGKITENEILKHKDNYVLKNNLRLSVLKGSLEDKLRLLKLNYEDQKNEALEVRKRELAENLSIVNKSLELAKKMNIEKNLFMPLHSGLEKNDNSEIQLNILSNGTDEQFEKIYYLKGSKFLEEEKKLLENQKITIPALVFERMSKLYLINKFNIEEELADVEYKISNLSKFDELFKNYSLNRKDNLFNYYITSENNITKFEINYLKLIFVNIILGFVFAVVMVILIESYGRNKQTEN